MIWRDRLFEMIDFRFVEWVHAYEVTHFLSDQFDRLITKWL